MTTKIMTNDHGVSGDDDDDDDDGDGYKDVDDDV